MVGVSFSMRFTDDTGIMHSGYSIGGPTTSEEILGGLGLLGTPSGLSGSDNNYEGDTSPTRGDLYLKYVSPVIAILNNMTVFIHTLSHVLVERILIPGICQNPGLKPLKRETRRKMGHSLKLCAESTTMGPDHR